MPTASAGMVFTIDPNISNGSPIAQNFPDVPGGGESNAETIFPGEWTLIVTGVPAATLPATIAALITSSPVTIPLPFKSRRWTIAYASLGSACTATNF